MNIVKKILLLTLTLVILFFTGFGAYTFLDRINEKNSIDKHSDVKETEKNDAMVDTKYKKDIKEPEPIIITDDENINISIYNKVNQSVVNITSKVIRYDWFLQPYLKKGAAGSGTIIDKEGHILTNVHVIEEAITRGGQLYVTMQDKTKYKADIVGIDPENDLALLKIEPKDHELKPIKIGESEQMRVGQKVLAIGNPFGLRGTLTTGIISSLGRTIKSSTGAYIEDIIQTDAAINPGNSGGPLLNIKGELIGVNTAIYSTTGSNIGIGFAVPSSAVLFVLDDLIKYGKVKRIKLKDLGLQNHNYYFVSDFKGLSEYLKLPFDGGIMIIKVFDNTPIDKIELKGYSKLVAYDYNYRLPIGGDVILEIEDKKIFDERDVSLALRNKKFGDIVNIKVWRDGKIKNFTLKF